MYTDIYIRITSTSKQLKRRHRLTARLTDLFRYLGGRPGAQRVAAVARQKRAHRVIEVAHLQRINTNEYNYVCIVYA